MPDTTTQPSIHPQFTKRYAIDQITDIERLREVAHVLQEAFSAQREQMNHLLAVHVTADEKCLPCDAAMYECDGELACDKYQEWQRAITRGVGVL